MTNLETPLYEFHYFAHFVVLFLIIILQATCDTLFYLLCNCIIGGLKQVQNTINESVEQIDPVSLRGAIKKHLELINQFDKTSSLYSSIVFMRMIESALGICVLSFAAFGSNAYNIYLKITALIFLIPGAGGMFVYSYIGESITEEVKIEGTL